MLGLTLTTGNAFATSSDESILVLGRVSNNPEAHFDRLQPLLDYVVERMAGVGIKEGRILMARDRQAMLSYLRQGRVDWVTETTGGAIRMIDRGQAEPLLRTWRGGSPTYYGLFVARKDSQISGLDDLLGRSIGFEHPMSTSGYMLPAGMLLEAGLPLAIMLSPLDQPSPDFVGYAFTDDALNSITWVHKRIVDVAAISDQDWARHVESVPEYAEDLTVFARSEPTPRGLELVRSGIKPAVRARLREVLLAVGDDPAAASALANYFGTTRFSDADDALFEQIEPLRQMIGRVRDELE